MKIVLIAVAADAEFTRIFRRLHHADTGRSRGMENHIGPAAKLALRQLRTFGRVTPTRRASCLSCFETPPPEGFTNFTPSV